MFDGRKTKTENDTLRDINQKSAHNGYYLDKEKYTENTSIQLRLQRHENSLLPASSKTSFQ